MAEDFDFADIFGCDPFEVVSPLRQSRAFVFNSPHSGRVYPQAFLDQSRLNAQMIRTSEDHYVDQLYACVPQFGVPMLQANFPRAWLDVNREPYELDPKMFNGPLPPHTNISSIRVSGGLGTVPKIVAENCEIYHSRMSVREGLDRVEHVYRPYHEKLRKLISRTHSMFGYAVLVDCHSMPSSVRATTGFRRPDFIIGDRYGTSADTRLTQIALFLLQSMGYHAAHNKPYAGGFITEHYGRPHRNLHALQIEINRGLYINEKTLELKPGFDKLADDLCLFVGQFMQYVEHELSDLQSAAE
ncbi:MAG: N-formylglutamate amidohydrolase [Lentilitoribacter sp.]